MRSIQFPYRGITATAGLCIALMGCGQKGDLYLPQSPSPDDKLPQSSTHLPTDKPVKEKTAKAHSPSSP